LHEGEYKLLAPVPKSLINPTKAASLLLQAIDTTFPNIASTPNVLGYVHLVTVNGIDVFNIVYCVSKGHTSI